MTDKEINLLQPKFICTVISMAIGIAVFVLCLMRNIAPISAISLIAISVICLAIPNLFLKE
ncbi:MAG: hypothetical protein Q4Q53_04235 [Methanocorpusculum sp.]|nr:hypothetical protein [Methanocorpusculum sp.]